MTYLVTGGTGLIGSRVVRDLVREGEDVVVYDWLPNRSSLTQVMSDEEIDGAVTIVEGDVADSPHLFRTILENGVERIIHLASLLMIESNANPLLALRVNCEGTVSVFEAARVLGLKKVVWASSNAIFGPPDMYPTGRIPNDAPYYPRNVYGATKAFNEVAATYYFNEYGVDITGIRNMHVYASGQRGGMFSTIVQQLMFNPALGKPGRVPHGDGKVGWNYVDDPVRATIMLSKVSMTPTRSYSINGDVRSVREAAEYVKELLPEADITVLPGDFAGDPVEFDSTPIEEEVGYRPEWTLERGIKETINSVRVENGLDQI